MRTGCWRASSLAVLLLPGEHVGFLCFFNYFGGGWVGNMWKDGLVVHRAPVEAAQVFAAEEAAEAAAARQKRSNRVAAVPTAAAAAVASRNSSSNCGPNNKLLFGE